MNRKSFLKTLFTGLVAAKVALEFGAKVVERPEHPNRKGIEEITRFFQEEQGRMSKEIAERISRPSPWIMMIEAQTYPVIAPQAPL
jgi:hypothetical protein